MRDGLCANTGLAGLSAFKNAPPQCAYYAAHREQVEAVWTWMATHQTELSGMLSKYSRK